MDRIAHATASADLFGSSKPGFTAGEVATQTPATVVTADWLNDVQEAIVRAIEAAGITPVSGTHTQLYDAILAIVANAQPANVISPTAVAGTQNAYEPTGWATAGRVRLSLTGAQTFNGLKLSTVPKLITNVDSSDSATFTNMSGSAAAGDKIATHTGASFILGPGETVLFVHDATTNVWRPVALNMLDKNQAWTGFHTFSNINGVEVQQGSLEVWAGDLIVNGEVNYGTSVGVATTKQRTVMVPLCSASYSPSWGFAAGGLSLTSSGPSGELYFPLPFLRSGCFVKLVRVAYKNVGLAGSAPEFQLYRVRRDKATPGVGTPTTPERSDTDGTAGLLTSPAQIMSSGTFTSTEVNLELDEWYLRVQGSDNAAGDILYWIEVTFSDPGPRNG